MIEDDKISRKEAYDFKMRNLEDKITRSNTAEEGKFKVYPILNIVGHERLDRQATGRSVDRANGQGSKSLNLFEHFRF